MNNLPIASNAVQPSVNAAITANAAQTDDPVAGLFAALLAQQIGENDAIIPRDDAQHVAAIEDNAAGGDIGLAVIDAKKQDANITDEAHDDPSNMLAAILLQFPQVAPITVGQARAVSDDVLSNPAVSTGQRNKTAIDAVAIKTATLADAKVDIATLVPGHQTAINALQNNALKLVEQAQPSAAAPGNQTAINALQNNALKLAEQAQPSALAPGHQTAINALQDNALKLAEQAQPSALAPGHQTAINALQDNALKLAEQAQPSAAAPGHQTAINALQDNALKLAEHGGIAESTTQALTVSAAIPNMLTGNRTVSNRPQIIDAPLDSAGWADEFSQKISWLGTQQNQIAELHLNPPNLGPLNVVLKISDNQATALFTSPHGAVRDAIENALPKLREMLADNGITLGNATVSDQPPRDRSAEGFMNQGSGTNAHRTLNDEKSATPDLALKPVQHIPLRRHNGMVDTFA